MDNIAIFASGGGSNAQKILAYFQNHKKIKVALILTNNPNAGVLNHAKAYGVKAKVVNKNQVDDAAFLVEILQKNKINFIVLAGYLKAIPVNVISAYPNKILNIHPALLPKYGGKGMYGMNVHNAVKANKDLFSGLTIHIVSKEYDKGKILFQKRVNISPSDTPEEIAKKILKEEHNCYSKEVEQYISTLLQN